jgi:hypothetical protein
MKRDKEKTMCREVIKQAIKLFESDDFQSSAIAFLAAAKLCNKMKRVVQDDTRRQERKRVDKTVQVEPEQEPETPGDRRSSNRPEAKT